jgi:serine/threonine protein kinase
MKDFEIEKRVYRRLGHHPNIIGCLGISDDAIRLERAQYGSIRQFYREGHTASLQERIEWSRDLASVVQYIHSKNVRHSDIGGKNILLDAQRNIRLCDFAGSAIDDIHSTVYAQDGFRHPDEAADAITQDIHALGSAIFELMTFTCPHSREEAEMEGMAAALLRDGKYPNIANVELGDVITKCWTGEYRSAWEVAHSISEYYIKFCTYSSFMTGHTLSTSLQTQ